MQGSAPRHLQMTAARHSRLLQAKVLPRARRRAAFVSMASLVALVACGSPDARSSSDSGSSPDAVSAEDSENAKLDAESEGADASARGDASTSPSDAGALQDAASDAPRPTPCPIAVPANGDVCPAGLSGECLYLDCGSYGQLTAACSAGLWHTTKSPCDPDGGVTCYGPGGASNERCASDQICQINESGAIWTTCVKNTCAPGLLSCDCLGCTGCLLGSFQLTCNLCPQGGCP